MNAGADILARRPSAIGSASDAADERFMRVALALGERNAGLTWPNPSVGALIVAWRDGEPVIVARGLTQAGGRPHAERIALEQAGEAARGATLYVTLEPCSHFGRSSPCADAVIAAGVSRVVSAMADPDPRVSGGGHERLRRAGVAVTTGVLAAEAARAHRGHVMRVTRARPFVTLKLARTADGFASAAGGPRLMITDAAANARVHLMRAHSDAILVGSGTVAADDPLLDVRLPGLERRSPVRVVLDGGLSLGTNTRIAGGAREIPTWIVAGEGASVAAERGLVAAGAEVMRVASDETGRIVLGDALRLLALRGITRIFCEGGPRLAEALARGGFVDEAVLLTAPTRLGAPGLPAIGPGLAAALRERFQLLERESVGPDIVETFERKD